MSRVASGLSTLDCGRMGCGLVPLAVELFTGLTGVDMVVMLAVVTVAEGGWLLAGVDAAAAAGLE